MFPLPLALFLALAPVQATSTRLNVRIVERNTGRSFFQASPGVSVRYSVRGELSDDRNEGLALFCFDLDFDGGAMHAAADPEIPPMTRFASPQGLSNPDGFGGTRVAGNLVQVGGGQNTINNIFAPQPNGPVATGVAQPGAEQELVVGLVDAPSQPGVYRLRLSNLIANVIREGETGFPFWRVDAVDPGQIDDLIIQVVPMALTAGDVSVARGGERRMDFHAGPAHAGERVIVLRSAGPVGPMSRIGALPRGLRAWQADRYVSSPDELDGEGRIAATFELPPLALGADWVGQEIHHVFAVLTEEGQALFSQPFSIHLIP